jgi:curli production assembly/transport component CsgF
MRRTTIALAALAATAGLAASAHAAPLTYTPVNPTFGGSPFNGSFLLGTAAANNYNHLTNPNAIQNLLGTQQQTTAQELQQALISALISQATNLAIQAILGTNGQAQNSGTFDVAGEVITFDRVNGQINITLTDPSGSQTQVSVPVPQF